MRRTVSPVAVAVALLAASPARAQAYDPAYPICLQVYGIQGGYIAWLHVDGSMPARGLGRRGAMHRQSLFRGRDGEGPGASSWRRILREPVARSPSFAIDAAEAACEIEA